MIKTSSTEVTQNLLKGIELLLYKCGDDIAVSVARSFERMEERMDAMEARLYSRLSDLSDEINEIRTRAATH